MWKNFLSIFKSSTGNYDIGRLISLKISLVFSTGFGYSIFKLHQSINWAEAGAGFSAVCLGIGGLIAAKEVGVAKANSLNGATNAGQ